jgi:nucleoside 2-deoxyribosyltransferase
MKRVYIAGPLFSQGELEFNLSVNNFVTGLGFETFLPQKDGHKLADLIVDTQKTKAIQTIFEKDIEEIKKTDILLFIMDGRVPDEGACVELGIAYAYNKICIGLKTDSRSLMDDIDNPLILGTLGGKMARSLSELKSILQKYESQNYDQSSSSDNSTKDTIMAVFER